MRKRTLLSLMALAPVVSACGFRLRGAPSFPFKTLYVQAPEGSPFTREVLRNLATAGGNLTVVLPPAKPDTAEATLQLQLQRGFGRVGLGGGQYDGEVATRSGQVA